MARGWTGGQFSLLRVALAALALSRIALDRGWPAADAPLTWPAYAFAGLACAALAVGFAARLSALLVAAGLLGAAVVRTLTQGDANWITPSGALGLALWLVLIAWLVPSAPYGSLAARGRADPAGSWRMPERLPRLGGLGLASGLTLAGATAWRDAPTASVTLLAIGTLVAAGLMVIPRGRAIGWSLAGVAMLLAALLPESSGGLLVRLQPALLGAWLIAFEPRWLRPRAPQGGARLFYDGDCGLCHGSVRLLLAEETGDERVGPLRFAPLGGPSLQESIPPGQRDTLPDSVVLVDGDGVIATRSRAVVRLGRRLGGLWRLVAELLSIVPRPLADTGYDLIARVRHRIAPTPDAACPLLPPRLLDRFDP